MTEPPTTNVITIDGHAIEYRLERRGEAAVLILHGGHMSARCRSGEEVFLAATLPHAKLIEVDTPTHLVWLGEGSSRTAAAINAFIER
ncbi:MAG TPA: hypothetical protein VI094_02315 [Propionibacteriaceae bacterium]